MNVQTIIDNAFKAAFTATHEYIRDELNGKDQYPCGFAWVTIKPARGPVVKQLKAMGMASKGYYGGVTVYNPSRSHFQNVDAKILGAEAFAKVLKENGINAVAESRWD